MRPKKKDFAAVAESRKWREATSRRLDAMSQAERITFLNRRLETLRASAPAKPQALSS
jgi:hypothetical protein